MSYSYQFDKELQQEWDWAERYSPQAEILSYAQRVAEKHDLRKHIAFKERVSECAFDAQEKKWKVSTNGGQYKASFVVLATGCLSVPLEPSFAGMESFQGEVYYTSKWPKEGVELAGKRVAVIGTGSSAIQCIPRVAEAAAHTTVYQRTPNYVVPAWNHELAAEARQEHKRHYDELRATAAATPFGIDIDMNMRAFAQMSPEEFRAELDRRWAIGGFTVMGACIDLVVNEEADHAVAEYIRERIRERVKDPATAELLCPTGKLSCKRVCVDTDYFEAYNRDNVNLVSIHPQTGSPLERFTEAGIRTEDGEEREHDAVVISCGFDAMTGAVGRINVVGPSGEPLKAHWDRHGVKTYLGLQTSGFPNLFLITGPQSPSVLSNMIPSIEQHVNFIGDLLGHVRERGLSSVEPEEQAQEAWVAECDAIANATIYTHPSCNSWYLGSNVDAKARHFLPYLGFNTYVERCEKVKAEGFAGFKVR